MMVTECHCTKCKRELQPFYHCDDCGSSDNWISVEDKLPVDDEIVLIYRPKMSNPHKFSVWIWWGYSPVDGVTHWMPLKTPEVK